jgi:hypothetical protein
MSEIKLVVRWTKVGDAAEHKREAVYRVEYPIVNRQTSVVEDLLLAIPVDGFHWHEICLPEPRAGFGDSDLLEVVELLKAQYADAERKREERKREEQKREEQKIAECHQAVMAEKDAVLSSEIPFSPEFVERCAILRKDCEDVRFCSWVDLEGAVGEELAQCLLSKVRAHNSYCLQAKKEEAQKTQTALTMWRVQWIAKNGSDRLKEQIALGYDGKSLFLREKIKADFPSYYFYLDYTDYDEVDNPSESQLEVERGVAEVLISLGLAQDFSEALNCTYVGYKMQKDDDGDWVRVVYLVVNNYTPYPQDIATKTYRLVCELMDDGK